MPQIKQTYIVNGEKKTRVIKVGLKCYSLIPRKPMTQKEVAGLFRTLEKEKKSRVEY